MLPGLLSPGELTPDLLLNIQRNDTKQAGKDGGGISDLRHRR